ncbi:hypothetical protein ABZ318_14800 [Streptomyces sp. NPDC006197]|uniref:hypothetical protein n=1 Tax=Streptomyces sp. NPDC006197 TaxID=3156685 RepID=UPI0033A94D50
MIRIAVIIGSTRPGRRAEAVARWAADTSVRHPAVAAGWLAERRAPVHSGHGPTQRD